jgi:DNA-binding MarR family transcriptional regulator
MVSGKQVVIEVKKLSNQFIRLLIECESHLDEKERLTGMQGSVIGYLVERCSKENVFQKDIEDEFNIRRSTATGILQLMEKKGLIRREPDPNDARWKKIVLTEKSLELAERFDAALKKFDSTVIKGISQRELAMFLGVIEQIKNNIKE